MVFQNQYTQTIRECTASEVSLIHHWPQLERGGSTVPWATISKSELGAGSSQHNPQRNKYENQALFVHRSLSFASHYCSPS